MPIFRSPIVNMNPNFVGPRYLMHWNHSSDQRLGRDVVTTTHRLSELPDFSDDGLADILDRLPRQAVRVFTTGENPCYPNQLRAGLIGSHRGEKLIRMVRCGRLRIELHDLTVTHQRLGRIVHRLFAELMECQPGLRTSEHTGTLEISSPGAMTYLRQDAKPSVYWQVRGSTIAWVYPPIDFNVDLTQNQAGRAYFEPAMDDDASILEHTAGNVLGLPEYTPFRFVNHSSLNVALRTQCHTQSSKRLADVCQVNQRLNQIFPRLYSTHTTGATATIKRALSRWMQPAEQQSTTIDPSFRVDPNEPMCIGPLDDKTETKPSISLAIPSSDFSPETVPTASIASEH